MKNINIILIFICLFFTNVKIYAGCGAVSNPNGLSSTVNADCSVALVWNITDATDTDDTEIEICTNAGFTANCVSYTTGSSTMETTTFTGFDPSTTYFWRVKNWCYHGSGDTQSSFVTSSFSTGACTPPPPPLGCDNCAASCGTCGFTSAPTVA
jgi:hypothetical protein